MKRTKRLLSTLLALCMVLAMLPATAMAAGEVAVKTRYTVLVLDQSGSMEGTGDNAPMIAMKAAAKKFCETMKTADTETIKNQVAIISFDNNPVLRSGFTNNWDALEAAIDSEDLYPRGGTDIAEAMLAADGLLKETPVGNIKNILLLTDGLPQHGDMASTGRYTSADHPYYYRQGNHCYNTARNMKANYNIYTLGFFHNSGYMDAVDQKFCARMLTDMASDPKLYHQVTDPSNLVFEFGVAAGEIIGNVGEEEEFKPEEDPYTRVYIECPVDVIVEYKGMSLTSKGLQIGEKKAETWGTMAVEAPKEGATGTTKIVTLPNAATTRYYNFNIEPYSSVTGEVNVDIRIERTTAAGQTATPVGSKQTVTVKAGEISQIPISSKIDAAEVNAGFSPVPVTPSPNPQGSDDNSHFTFVPTTVGGTVVLSKRNAEPGDWVNIYVTPDKGYKLESLTVTDMRGLPVTVREMGENAFSFTMPNTRINVNPVFVKVEEDNDQYSTVVPDTIPNIEGTSPNYGNMVINTAAMNYSDVNAGDWFYDNVKFCHERYLLNKTGEADGKFEPNTASTRATVWTALSRLAGRNTVTQGDNWYDRAQIWAKGKGITDGERPMDSMTREEFVTMLWRYDGNKYVQNNALGQFNDGSSVSWWATEAVKWAVATGLLNGSNGSLNPQSNVTRAEVAAVLQRYVQNVH